MCLSIPKQVVAWEGEGDFAWVERNGQREFLNMMLLGPQPVGTWVLTSMGLAKEVVEPEQLDTKVQEIVSALFQGGPLAQSAAKDLIRAVDGQMVNETLVEETAQRIAHLRATPEAREGIAAFLDKRQPNWIGE